MSNFKGSQGKWFTLSLFLEHDYDPEDLATFTHKSEDHTLHGKTYISARRLFVETGDPTGYTFALEYLGGWAHWKAWLASPPLRKRIDEWVEEVEIKLKAEALHTIKADADSGSKSSVSSAKYLADKGYQPKRKAGAPSKAEKERKVKENETIKDEYDVDFNRLKLVKD